MNKNGRIGESGESARQTVAPGGFRVVSAPKTISVGGENASGDSSGDRLRRREALALNASNRSDERTESTVKSLKSSFFNAGVADAETNDDEFDDENAFFASFSGVSDARQGNESFDVAFAGGLRSIFDAESDDETSEKSEDDADENDASDAERFQRDLERERRESLDGVLMQNDADFLREAGEKYEQARVSNADFERKNGSRFPANALLNEKNEQERENGRNAQNEGSDGRGRREGIANDGGQTDESVVGANEGRRVPIGPTSILEAMLFVGDRENRPLTLARATELMRNVSETEAIEALADLNERYWRDGAPYRIVRVGDGFRMALRPEFDALAARFVGGKNKEFKLTQTMIDVLALIAYRQPISLDEILETRNNATAALAQLVKRDLVAQEKRVVDKKKIAVYSTTARFLRLFNLESLDDLPIVGDVDYR